MHANRTYDPSAVDRELLFQTVRALPAQHSVTLKGSNVKITALGGMGGRRFIVQVPDHHKDRTPVEPGPYTSARKALEDATKVHQEVTS